ncbi:alpha/beta hydrolase [Olivibacter sp. XZL3]|uniref:alpha/beta hydrolase n=1 Tax=Olivibacter sp. XZL3 TaxID=1735116 RepID=UPI0019804DFE|nr:alpha/beta hydrolase [Olivibacter sp. XZL3]
MIGRNTILLFSVFTANCTSPDASVYDEPRNGIETEANISMDTHLTVNNLVEDIAKHPAFQGFGNLLLPSDNNTRYYNTPIRNIGSLMPYHNAVHPDEEVAALNRLIDDVNSNKTVFYSFYSDEQIKQDPRKNNTGLFFYRGEPDAPFAIVCPGGGFSYVGSLHEGLPLASEISKKKLNAFVVRYRIGSEQWATEDLAEAIRFVFENASTLKVDTKNYSLWGGSAGARMVGNIAYYGVNAFVQGNYPNPAAAIIAYTGQSLYSENFPPTFITVSANDPIANIRVMERRVQNLKNVGVTVQYERYEKAGHGFGLGTGTDAADWLYKAVDFWRSQMKE